ncbi:hypothetical protein M407DRAFT_6706 [Tulasnella calospora MUT 4182]|uniref:BRCT domain-containing protein n=1 Tax=Tulasnella calospora MUT 4182 TaxID=1051891 RepID=A0A0C3L405_9AGAM|nr:hypothetical protein M407DRAFT_6706 [Tulasnella calospora MUT 4182]
MARTPPLVPRQDAPASDPASNSDVGELEDDEWTIFDGGKLFTNADHTSFTFMFHPTLHQYTEEREKTKELIEDNGGVMVDDEANADIILADDKRPLYHKLSQRIIRTTAKKHVETLRWVETCIIICKVQFTRDTRSRRGRPAGNEPRTFSPSEKEHIIYYLAHRSPYIPSTQKWQFAQPQSKRPYYDNVSRAGNRIWKELFESARPWARNHPWQAYREHYVRNRAQYDFWIQLYVDENLWLLSEVAQRLIKDFLDEPGAFEDELPQEEHSRIIAHAPKRPATTRAPRSPARAATGMAGNHLSRSFSRPVDLPPNQSQANISNLRPSVQQPHRRLGGSPTSRDDASWLINSSDEEDLVTAPLPPNPHHSLSQRSNGVEEEEARRETADQVDDGAPSHPFNRHQVQGSAEAFRRQPVELDTQNGAPVTRRKPERPRDSLTSARESPSTPRAETPGRTLNSEIDETDVPAGVESSLPSRLTTTAWPLLEEFNVGPSGGSAQDEMHAELERQISLLYENEHAGVFSSDDVPSLEVENHPASNRPKRKKSSSVPDGQRTLQSRKPRSFQIKCLSQSEKPTTLSRQEEMTGSVLVYHLGRDGGGAMVRRSSKHGTPVRGAERTNSSRNGSPFSSRASETSFPRFPFNPFEDFPSTRQRAREQHRSRSKRVAIPASSKSGSTAEVDPVAPPLKRRRTEDGDNGQKAGVPLQGDEAQSQPTKPQQAATNVTHSRKQALATLEVPLKPFVSTRFARQLWPIRPIGKQVHGQESGVSVPPPQRKRDS